MTEFGKMARKPHQPVRKSTETQLQTLEEDRNVISHVIKKQARVTNQGTVNVICNYK